MNVFAITPGSDNVALAKGRQGASIGEVSFTVSNSSGAGLRAEANVAVDDEAQQGWYRIELPERDLQAGGTTSYTVAIQVPSGAPAGDHRFRLRVAAKHNTDETATLSAPVGFKVEPGAKPFRWWIVAVAAGVLLLAVLGAVLAFAGGGVKVPNVIDQSIDDARATLGELGFDVVERLQIGERPEKTVVAIEPPPGTELAEGAQIVVTYEPELVATPRLIGLEQAAAAQQLQALQLVLADAIEERRQNPGQAGRVVAQTPGEGERVRLGTTVALAIEAPLRTVPELRALAATAALGQLAELGLLADVQRQRQDASKAGQVVEQEPARDSLIQRGGTVRLVIEESRIQVPELVGKSLQEASAALQQLGLVAAAEAPQVFPVGSAGTVGATVPPGGTPMLAGTDVKLIPVGEAVAVPNVLGKTQGEAEQALQAAGLATQVSVSFTKERQKGTVIDLTPSEGTRVLKGSRVLVSVATDVLILHEALTRARMRQVQFVRNHD